jgi:hypothetical protein
MADFEVISEVTLGSSTSQWVIADIPQDYTHLELDLHLRATTFNNGTYPGGMTFNTFTGSNVYGNGVVYSNNSDNGSASDVGPDNANRIQYGPRISGDGTANNSYAINKMFIANYSSTAILHKQILWQQSAATGDTSGGSWFMGFGAGAKTNCGAITQLTIWPDWGTSGQEIKAGSCYTLSGWK